MVNLKERPKIYKIHRSTAISILSWNTRHPAPVLLLVCLAAGMGVSLLPTSPHQTLFGWILAGAAGVLCLIWGGLSLTKRLPGWGHGVFWWGIGFFLRLRFILHFPYWVMQHDVLTFDGEKGHAGYILYLYKCGHLPDFDVRTVWQYYHPPLHHLLCAGWMRVGNVLNLSDAQVYESIQALPFAYSCLLLAVFGLLLRELGLSGRAFVIPFSVMAVHPSQIILAGSLNNDVLSILFMLLSLLLAIRWFRVPEMHTILCLALTIGLGMFTKLSAWMAAPAAAMLFLCKLAQTHDFTGLSKLWKQFAGFGAVSIPIGLFWSVRNLAGWGIPPAYIPRLAEDNGQYVGNHPIWERLFGCSPQQFVYIYDCFTIYGQSYNEYNPLIALLKTAVFDEFVNTDRFPAVRGFGDALFWTQVLLAAWALFAMIRVLRRADSRPEIAALPVTYAVVLGFYILFCLRYPHTCTQNFRYAVPTLYCSLACFGLFLQETKPPAWMRVTVSVLAGCFVGLSGLLYGGLLYVNPV